MRSRTNRKIAGICGGLAIQFGWDATVVRLLWIALVLFAGTGVLAYLILWVVVPEEPLTQPRTGPAPVYPSTQPRTPATYDSGALPLEPYPASAMPHTQAQHPPTQGSVPQE